MAERITVTDSLHQIFNVTLAGRNYGIELRYNSCWDRWSIELTYQGTVAIGPLFLQVGIPLFANIGCLPLDFGALYLEERVTPTSHKDGLPAGDLRLLFFEDPESYAIWGHI